MSYEDIDRMPSRRSFRSRGFSRMGYSDGYSRGYSGGYSGGGGYRSSRSKMRPPSPVPGPMKRKQYDRPFKRRYTKYANSNKFYDDYANNDDDDDDDMTPSSTSAHQSPQFNQPPSTRLRPVTIDVLDEWVQQKKANTSSFDVWTQALGQSSNTCSVSEPHCLCNKLATMRHVSMLSANGAPKPNGGRAYWTCASKRCDFFCWAQATTDRTRTGSTFIEDQSAPYRHNRRTEMDSFDSQDECEDF